MKKKGAGWRVVEKNPSRGDGVPNGSPLDVLLWKTGEHSRKWGGEESSRYRTDEIGKEV